jgi:hypothetical protein
MTDDALNMSVRKFLLKKVGVTSQREIEEAVRAAVGKGKLKGNEVLPAKVTLTVGGIDLSVDIEGAVEFSKAWLKVKNPASPAMRWLEEVP